MLTFTEFAEGYRDVLIDPAHVVFVQSAEKRPTWSDGFCRRVAVIHLDTADVVTVLDCKAVSVLEQIRVARKEL